MSDDLDKKIKILEEEIKSLKKRKKYGLVWEDHNETSINENSFPVLEEVQEKQIISDKNKKNNLLIEGDNYHSLKSLLYTHKESIDTIYIDPPYNTGLNDFIYNDKIIDKEDNYKHSKWLSFMEKRLSIAKELLSEEGIILISIDDNEFSQLKLLCDEIFGEKNFYGNLTWISRTKPKNMGSARFKIQHNLEYILMYGKTPMVNRKPFNLEIGNTKKYDLKDSKGNRYRLEEIPQRRNIGRLKRDTMVYEAFNQMPKEGYRWQLSKQKYNELKSEEKLIMKKNKMYKIIYETEEDGFSYVPFYSHLENVGTAETGKNQLNEILGFDHKFETVKPIDLLKKLIYHTTNKNSIILDFFAGSGTTGHAVLELNKEDNGNRNFIICTNNENKICEEITYPRIKNAIQGYKGNKGNEIFDLGGNLKYYKSSQIGSLKEYTDELIEEVMEKATELLKIKHDCYDFYQNKEFFYISKNKDTYLGILKDEYSINDFINEFNNKEEKKIIYLFSWSDEKYDILTKQIKKEVKNVEFKLLPKDIINFYRQNKKGGKRNE